MPRPVRVLSIPSAHDYVRHLSWPGADDDVQRLPDVPVPGAPAGQWWPPPGLTSGWVRSHAGEIDLVHVHFGFESFSVPELADWLATTRDLRLPVVLTVHDLINPHLDDQRHHQAQLDLLVPAAHTVITLTDRAAAEIERRWGRAAIVLPHPHILGLDDVGLPRPGHGPGAGSETDDPTAHDAPARRVIGVALNSLRANVAAVSVVSALLDAVADDPGRELRVHVHPSVMASDQPRHREVARWLRSHEHELTLAVRPPLSQNDFRDFVYGLDLAVLPYRFGTHSGWLEACVDAGTRVLAPEHGCYSDQHAGIATYRVVEGRMVDPVATVSAALDAPAVRMTRAQRQEQRRELALAHRRLYLSALGDPTGRAEQAGRADRSPRPDQRSREAQGSGTERDG